jgi:hypothetical protein
LQDKDFLDMMNLIRKMRDEMNWDAIDQNIATIKSILKDEEHREQCGDNRIKSDKP